MTKLRRVKSSTGVGERRDAVKQTNTNQHEKKKAMFADVCH